MHTNERRRSIFQTPRERVVFEKKDNNKIIEANEFDFQVSL